MNNIRIVVLMIFIMSSGFAEDNKVEICEGIVKSIYAAALKNDLVEFTNAIHPKSYYGNGEYGAKALMKEILVGNPEIISIKHVGSGRIREYVEVYVNRKDSASPDSNVERKTVFYLVSLGLSNGRYLVFSTTFVADGVELSYK